MENGAVAVPGNGRHAGTPGATAAGPEETARLARLVALAVIGNRLRVPVACCEAGSCGARYDDPAALGEADIRSRAIAAGWREDLTGLLTCPGCQRRAPWPEAFRPAPAGAARHHQPAPDPRPPSAADGHQPAPAYPPAPAGYPSGPQGYPSGPQGFPSGPQGFPPGPQGFPPVPAGYPATPAPPPAGPPYPART